MSRGKRPVQSEVQRPVSSVVERPVSSVVERPVSSVVERPVSSVVERSCCICRARAEKRSLLRFACVEGRLTLDEGYEIAARGAYVHPAAMCVARAGNAGRWERSLRLAPGTLKGMQVAELFADVMSRVVVGDVG